MHTVNLVFTRIVIMILMFVASSAAISAADLTEAEVENIARRSYPYVAMYNVNNKIALDPGNALSSGGWNRVAANTTLTDHNLQIIARPNNDTLYASAPARDPAWPTAARGSARRSKSRHPSRDRCRVGFRCVRRSL